RAALVRGQPDPRHPGRDHPRAGRAGQPRQPGGRCDREIRRAHAGRPRSGGPVMTPAPGAIPLDRVERAVTDIAAGGAVVVVDDADRENEGDIVFAASKATPELMAFTIRYARGLICAPMLGEDLDRLQLPPMTSDNQEHMGTAFTISVDARDGITTGISAADRARTVRVLVDSATEPYEIVRPGHIFPLRYTEGGVLRRPGHTEAAVDLARLAGLTPAGVVAEIFNDDGTMARLPELRAFADRHGLAMITIAQLIEFRRHSERMVRRVVETRLPNAHGEWRALGYQDSVDGIEHIALALGDLGDGQDVLARVHSECLTGDVLGSRRCDCGAQLDAAMAAVAAEGRGVVCYLRGHEGRGIGLLSKLRAYLLQAGGADTVDATLELGLPADARDYSIGAQILADLGVRSVRLLTNNPAKVAGLAACGIEVTGMVPLSVEPTRENMRYLTASGTASATGSTGCRHRTATATPASRRRGERHRPADRHHGGRGRADPGHRGDPLARGDHRQPGPPGLRGGPGLRYCRAAGGAGGWRGGAAGGGGRTRHRVRRRRLPRRGDPRRHAALRVRLRRGDGRADQGRPGRQNPGRQRGADL